MKLRWGKGSTGKRRRTTARTQRGGGGGRRGPRRASRAPWRGPGQPGSLVPPAHAIWMQGKRRIPRKRTPPATQQPLRPSSWTRTPRLARRLRRSAPPASGSAGAVSHELSSGSDDPLLFLRHTQMSAPSPAGDPLLFSRHAQKPAPRYLAGNLASYGSDESGGHGAGGRGPHPARCAPPRQRTGSRARPGRGPGRRSPRLRMPERGKGAGEEDPARLDLCEQER